MHIGRVMLIAAAGAFSLYADDTLESVITRMDRSASSFQALSSDVRRLAHTEVINEDNIDTGTMLLKRTKPSDMRMLVNLTNPDPKSVALQGRKLEIYFPKIQTVQEYDVGKNRELMDQFLLLGFGSSGRELASAYAMKVLGPETVAGRKATAVELAPKSEQVLRHLKKVQLWIPEDNGYPIQQKFFLPGGDYMLVTYTNTKFNPRLSDDNLKLKLPKGVKREFPQK